MGNIPLIKRLLIGATTLLIASFSHFYSEARETYISKEIIDLCDKYGCNYDIDKYFLIAIIECESSGIPSVVSANGQYVGLMQLNKDTFYGDLTDAENNIDQGAAYIDRLRDYYRVNALGAYSYYCGESGRCGFYTQKVINHYFELYCTGVLGKEDKRL